MEKSEQIDLVEAVTFDLIRAGGGTDVLPTLDEVMDTVSSWGSLEYSPQAIAQPFEPGNRPLGIEELIRGVAGIATTAADSTAEPPPAAARQPSSDLIGQITRSLVTGLGLVSLFQGLFGGTSDTHAQDPLVLSELPPQISADLTYDAGAMTYANTSYDLTGMPRSSSNDRPVQVTVNVSAIDSKSFVEHSSEIAHAVREAVLNSHPLNDIISEW